MHITGIITEYNPFHNGHQYHIQETKKKTNCDLLINVMSGNFVQRGEPAICDKWKRAKKAIEHGCDIVIELPFIYATQSADFFAEAAIQCLQLAGVQDVVFGSETNDLDKLYKLASIQTHDYKHYMKDGLSLIQAYTKQNGNIQPNDILGINYIKYLQSTSIKPYTIQRTNQYHGEDIQNSIASATAIRKAFYNQLPIEHATCMAKELILDFSMKHYYPYIQTLLCTLDKQYLSQLFLMDEGIENHLIKQAKLHQNFDDFLNACISKRYTKSKIRRTLIHLMTQTTKHQVNSLPPLQHLRILAFNDKGRKYLKELKEQVHIASKFTQIPKEYREMELKAAHVYAYPLNDENKQSILASELQSAIYIKSK
ncbi:MAG: nucleotidyltransferase family protein [Erysipelotrichaceae bacterium]|nr:nucleotidyltransferase family protein [Erysipelotrichaceae bacterium]